MKKFCSGDRDKKPDKKPKFQQIHEYGFIPAQNLTRSEKLFLQKRMIEVEKKRYERNPTAEQKVRIEVAIKKYNSMKRDLLFVNIGGASVVKSIVFHKN